MSVLRVDFCGEVHEVQADGTVFTIGRKADLSVDDNRHLHRQFLAITYENGSWWLRNIGTALVAVLVAVDTGAEIRLPPGAVASIGFERGRIRFEAGGTDYEVDIEIDGFELPPLTKLDPMPGGNETISVPQLTINQKLVVVALAEPALRSGEKTSGAIPTSAQAAARLGVPLTSFNRRLDKICEKFAAAGVRGLHGGVGSLSANRRVRLVEFALLTQVVTTSDLDLLESATGRGMDSD